MARYPWRFLQVWFWATGTIVLDSKVDNDDCIWGIDFPDLENTLLVRAMYSIQVWDVINGSVRLVIPLSSSRWSSTCNNLVAAEAIEGISIFNIVSGARILWLASGISGTPKSMLMKAGVFVMGTATASHEAYSPLKVWDVGPTSGVHSTADSAGSEEWPKCISGPMVSSIPFK